MLSIYLHEARKPIRQISVMGSDSIQILHKEVEGNQRHFIYYKNSILMTAFTFNYFGVKDGDHIYILTISPQPQTLKDSQIKNQLDEIRTTREQLSSKGPRIKGTSRKSIIHECTRLIDLMYLRDDSYFPRLRGITTSKGDNNREVIYSAKSTTHTIFEPSLSEPSTSSLPTFWIGRKGRIVQRNPV